MNKRSGRFLSFDPVAAEYDRTRAMPQSVLDDVARACAREARLSRGGWFLDAATGTGRYAVPLARLHPGQIIGADISAAMLAEARRKASLPALSSGGPSWAMADVQRLPFRSGAFAGALAVHLLHLVEDWRRVLDELRRVLKPQTGVLLLGGEQGGRSALVNFYYERARARGVLSHSLGTPGFTQALAYLRRDPRAQAQMLSLPYLKWDRPTPLPETLHALDRRTYSQMWDIPDAAHAALMAETQDYAQRVLGGPEATEKIAAKFALYAIRWL